ncbi:protein GLUTAMINE DUMPER 4 [Punica granatum]|uniref:Uncharacterized protein n=2 Tax=Punica granatum TaxID=22663 RepID=A0A218VVG4_PUNGR|nr:protein GLUTAMINE DUMPER 4 [Punica granatum]OWM64465.1 hypothetical protein CDL15_Pgr020432 [Punica granatum]PKI75579.1 hypothetical protein CRG98_003980 [Punica granatum]
MTTSDGNYYDSSRRASNSSMEASSVALKRLDSPIPYLFGGLALMLIIMAVSLIILACSHRKNDSHDNADDEEKNPAKQVNSLEADEEPRVVVIMAGDELPTYLARPTIASSACPAAR